MYFRMFLTMSISLYTSRVVLQALGVEDYGIYNAVAGVMAMIGILKGMLAGGSSRFITFALGKNDLELGRKYFSVSLTIYFLLSLLIVIVAETFGLWFLNTQMVIPSERIIAANWVFQFTILSLVNELLAGPYGATIVAHEQMGIYAYIGIFEAIYKLVIVFVVMYSSTDRLILYGFLLLLGEIIVRMVYRTYCYKRYSESHYYFCKDWKLYKEVLSFSMWNIFGTVSTMVKGQGLNILLNLFFNPTVNAARGIAYQVNGVLNTFVSNFYMAVRPQITKYYAQNDKENLFKLVFRTSKLNFFLILLLAIPLVIETPFIIRFWLGKLPENVVEFFRYIVLISALEGMQNPLMTTAQATGKIAYYQVVIGMTTMLNIPISYILLKLGGQPIVVFQVSLCIAIICLILRLVLLRKICDFPVGKYFRQVLCNALAVSILAISVPLFFFLNVGREVIDVVAVCFVSTFWCSLIILFVGLKKEERGFILNIISKKIGLHKK